MPKRVKQAFAVVGLAIAVLVAAVVGTFVLGEFRLQAIERRYESVARDLVARHVSRAEARTALQGLRGARTYDLQPGDRRDVSRPTLLAIDPSEFGFFGGVMRAEPMIFFDKEDRAFSFRIHRGGTAL